MRWAWVMVPSRVVGMGVGQGLAAAVMLLVFRRRGMFSAYGPGLCAGGLIALLFLR